MSGDDWFDLSGPTPPPGRLNMPQPPPLLTCRWCGRQQYVKRSRLLHSVLSVVYCQVCDLPERITAR